MAFQDKYRQQVSLLVRIIPFVAEEECFALKGGTAINLFVRDMPRLSVDIDLTYLPVKGRKESLEAIDAAMKRIAERIRKGIGKIQVAEQQHDDAVTWLLARTDNAQVKIEVTPVLRGCVFEPETRRVSERVEDAFGFAEMKVVSWGDLYAGKIVAALDRQHPRDLFDVRDLLAVEGIDDKLRTAFIVYMLSHNRPMAEVLAPKRKEISEEFKRGFDGMTDKTVSLNELLAAREEIIQRIVGDMPDEHRRFLVSFERGEPDWALLGVDGASELPAVKWRSQNLDKLPSEKRAALVEALEKALAKSE